MSETVEPDHVPGYRRFDCTDPDGDPVTAGTDAARQAIEQGDCIVLPTDTVYGIGADAFSPAAVQKLLSAKHRGRDMPPPVLMGDASLIRALATEVPDAAKELIARHWPGPLTVICKIQPSLRMDLGETDGTIALRVPDHPLAREVLRRTGPMAVSSANLSGRPAALSCEDAIDQLGDSVAVYLDGGVLEETSGASSTIVDFTRRSGGQVLRHGAISLAVLRETLPDVAELDEPVAGPEPESEPSEEGPSDAGPSDAAPTDAEPSDAAPTDAAPTDAAPTAPEATPPITTEVPEPAGAHVLSAEPEVEDSVMFEEGVAWEGDADTETEPAMPRLVNERDAGPSSTEPPGREQQKTVS